MFLSKHMPTSIYYIIFNKKRISFPKFVKNHHTWKIVLSKNLKLRIHKHKYQLLL